MFCNHTTTTGFDALSQPPVLRGIYNLELSKTVNENHHPRLRPCSCCGLVTGAGGINGARSLLELVVSAGLLLSPIWAVYCTGGKSACILVGDVQLAEFFFKYRGSRFSYDMKSVGNGLLHRGDGTGG